MRVAYYMSFTRGHHGAKNRVGGDPTFLPSNRPWPREDDEYLGFVMELWIDPEYLDVPDTVCLQLYQPIDEGDDPTPEVVHIRRNDIENTDHSVLVHPLAEDWDISLETKNEPEVLPEILPTVESCAIFKSKIGGLDPWEGETEGKRFLGQIKESPLGLNFGGRSCVLYLIESRRVIAELR